MIYRKVIVTGEIVDVVECEGVGFRYFQDIFSERTFAPEELEPVSEARAVENLHPVGEAITGVKEIDSTEILKNFDECIQPKLSEIFSEKGWDLDHKSAYNGYLEGVFWVLGKIKKKEVYE